MYENTGLIAASEVRWGAGVSYHTGAPTASSASVAIAEVAPFEVTLGRTGPSWVFVAVITYDAVGDERGFHGQWRNLWC